LGATLKEVLKMNKIILTSAFALFATTGLAFAEPSCTPGASVKPMWESLKTFESAGGVVLQMKINPGKCYEVYGKIDGKKFEVFYDPNTGAEIGRIAA
jgi:hypothetical protein